MGQQLVLTCGRGLKLEDSGVPRGTALEPGLGRERGQGFSSWCPVYPLIKDPVFQGAGRGSAIWGASYPSVPSSCRALSALHRLSSEKCRHLPEIRLPRMSKSTIFNNSVEVCSLHHKLHPFLVQWHIFCSSVLCRAVITINYLLKYFAYLHVFLGIHKIPSACSQ